VRDCFLPEQRLGFHISCWDFCLSRRATNGLSNSSVIGLRQKHECSAAPLKVLISCLVVGVNPAGIVRTNYSVNRLHAKWACYAIIDWFEPAERLSLHGLRERCSGQDSIWIWTVTFLIDKLKYRTLVVSNRDHQFVRKWLLSTFPNRRELLDWCVMFLIISFNQQYQLSSQEFLVWN